MHYTKLEAIRDAIRHARNMIGYMASPTEPQDLEDKELKEIYYSLNSMAIAITKKITPPWEE